MKNLKKLREAHKMSQQKLAEELFVTQQSIYKYENYRQLSPDVKKNILFLLNHIN